MRCRAFPVDNRDCSTGFSKMVGNGSANNACARHHNLQAAPLRLSLYASEQGCGSQ